MGLMNKFDEILNEQATTPVSIYTLDQLLRSVRNLRATLLLVTSEDCEAFIGLDEKSQRDILFMITEMGCDACEAVQAIMRGE